MALPVTMKTLADHLGVSVATVSNAYSRPDQLSAELREQILQAADDLGYAGPSVAGRALRSGKLDICGFMYSDNLSHAFSDPYKVIFLSGLTDSVQLFGASILLLQATDDPHGAALLQRVPIDALVGRLALGGTDSLQTLRRRGVRLVSTYHCADGDWVGIDDVAAGRLLGRHLAGLGHRDVVVVVAGGPAGPCEESAWAPDGPGVEFAPESFELGRLSGLWEALGGGPLRVLRVEHNTREAGRAGAAQVLDVRSRPTAVVALSDVLAFGVLDAARERGLTPGRDLSITGFDDVPDADFLGITTIHQPIAEKGRIAGLLAMDPTHEPRQVTLPIELVVRCSTGPAPRNPHPLKTTT
jgi:DNA-binding LacI/PurR family transcriptional regulator